MNHTKNLRLHSRIRDEILKSIENGKYKPLDQLPSEDEIAKKLSVSRSSVRNALLSLEQDGVVLRRHGIGTFVAPYPIRLKNRVDQLNIIPEQITNLGYMPDLSFNESSQISGPSHAHEMMDLDIDEKIMHSKRLYLANKKPAVFIDDYLRITFDKSEVKWEQFSGNMVEFLENEFNLHIEYTYGWIKSVKPSKEIARILQIEESFPLLTEEQVSYDSKGIPIAYGISYHNSEIMEFDFVGRRR
jgi:GntR family transcriptional regulator